jgi:rhamnosyltransferase
MPTVTSNDVAAVVVLYRPSSDVVSNVAAFANQVDRVFAIDNSEGPDSDVVSAIREISNVEYIPLGENLGIAAALNIGARHALEAGYPWVLTMDQDSTATSGMVAALLRCAADKPANQGLFSPVHRQEGVELRARESGCREVLTAMTSGNLLSVAALERVGWFDESLFIDSVDHDLCLRLHDAGLGVFEYGAAVLMHRVGATRRSRLIVSAHPSHHSSLRRYYITRNRFIVSERHREKHPEYRVGEMRALRRELVKIVLFEDDKLEKLRMSWRGYRDYTRGVTGPYSG